MNKLKQYLTQPAYYDNKPWLVVGLVALCVALMLAIFEPFNYRLNSINQLWVLIGFVVLASAGAAIVHFIFPKIFKRFYNPDTWTVAKNLLNIIFILLICGIMVVCYELFFLPTVFNYPLRTDILFWLIYMDMFATFTIGIVPLTISTMLIQNSALKRNLTAAVELNKSLSAHVKSQPDDSVRITLSGATKESLTVAPNEIIYIESQGNYTDVYYRQNDKVLHKLLRSTIKQMEEELQHYPVFVRCHRAFIVNVDYIYNVSGNAQGYKLSLNNVVQEIPVSRTYMKNLKASLA